RGRLCELRGPDPVRAARRLHGAVPPAAGRSVEPLRAARRARERGLARARGVGARAAARARSGRPDRAVGLPAGRCMGGRLRLRLLPESRYRRALQGAGAARSAVPATLSRARAAAVPGRLAAAATDRYRSKAMLIRNSLAYVLARGLPGLVNLAALALYSRLLSPEAYGRYVLVIAGVMLVGTIAFQWQRSVVIRWLPARADTARQFLGESACLFLALTLALSAIGALVVFCWPDPVRRQLLGVA